MQTSPYVRNNVQRNNSKSKKTETKRSNQTRETTAKSNCKGQYHCERTTVTNKCTHQSHRLPFSSFVFGFCFHSRLFSLVCDRSINTTRKKGKATSINETRIYAILLLMVKLSHSFVVVFTIYFFWSVGTIPCHLIFGFKHPTGINLSLSL